MNTNNQFCGMMLRADDITSSLEYPLCMNTFVYKDE